MGRSLRQSLQDLVRNLGVRTTPDTLKKRGLKSVNVVGLDRIALLIEESVDRILRQRSAELDSSDRAEIAGATRQEFVRLLKDHEDLAGSKRRIEREKQALESQIARLRQDLASEQAALAQRLEAPGSRAAGARATSAADAALADRIQALFREHGEAGPRGERLRVLVMAAIDQALAAERARVEASRRTEHTREVDLLERRIRKLSDSLERTEHELQRVSSLKDLDAGVASVYRTVQGLSTGTPDAQQKQGMMSAIFQANLELKRRRGNGKEPPTTPG